MRTEKHGKVNVLVRAIRTGDVRAVYEMLCDKQFRNELRRRSLGSGAAPLFLAAEHNQIEIAKILIQHGFDVDQVSTEDAHTALEIAALNGYVELCVLLLEHGASPTRKGRKKGIPSALASAAFRGELALVNSMLLAGADPQDVCSSGIPSLMRIRGDVLRLLESAGGTLPEELTNLLRLRQALGDQDKNATGS